MAQKLAIFDERDQAALLGSCESDNEFIPIWLMMRCGMHPTNVRRREEFRLNGQFLEWKRVKNSKNRREIIPDDIRPRLERWMKTGRKLTREGYFHLVRRIGARIEHPEYSPMTLRHTFCIQELRRFMRMTPQPPDFIALLSQKMGTTRNVVMQNYIDLEQWERVGQNDPELSHN